MTKELIVLASQDCGSPVHDRLEYGGIWSHPNSCPNQHCMLGLVRRMIVMMGLVKMMMMMIMVMMKVMMGLVRRMKDSCIFGKRRTWKTREVGAPKGPRM